MIYAIIGTATAIVIIGVLFYLVYRKRRVTRFTMPEVEASEPSETTPESPETISETGKTYHVVPEPSSLPEDAKNALMNAVWYRCENPHCNYTRFLDVHHIIPEVEGGSNRLDNLTVLCSKCQAAASNHEISEEELQFWVQERTERFKTALDWPYK